MRLHRLEVTAFGPFAETSVVDFDALSESGLFLIHGPTGAGKTSLLDAICFALYAGVPGGRGTGSGAQLRSHHAAEKVAPSVVLELTAAGRRLRITRSPAWSKPSRTHPVPAKVALEELRHGRWEAVSARADEVGDVVGDVLGMGRQQFERVVLLPQGDFAAFLRSSAEDRRKVLDRLFDVSTYAGVEAWLSDRRREGAAALAERRTHIARLAAQLAEVAAGLPSPVVESGAAVSEDAVLARDRTPSPSRTLVDDMGTLTGAALDPGTLSDLLPVVQSRLDDAVTAALAGHDRAERAATAAAERLAAARTLAALQARGARAREERATLAQADEGWEPQRLALAEAERAAPLRGHLEAVQAATEQLAHAGSSADVLLDLVVTEQLTAAEAGSDRPGPDQLHSLHATLTDLDRGVATLDGAGADLRRLYLRNDDQRAALDAALAQAEAFAEAARQAEAVSASLHERYTNRARVAAGEEGHRGVHAHLTAQHRLVVAVQDGASALVQAADALRSAIDADQVAKESVIALRTARLDDMAAELAAKLAPGEPCAVCGSPEHPRPATGRHAVTAGQIADAERVSESCSATRARRAADLATLRGAQSERLAALGEDAPDEPVLAAAVSDAAREVRLARTAALEAQALSAELASAGVALQEARAAHEASGVRVTAAQAALAELARQVDDALDRLSTAAVEHAGACPCVTADPVPDPAIREVEDRTTSKAWLGDSHRRDRLDRAVVSLVDRHREARTLARRAVEALRAVEQRSSARRTIERALDRELAEAGFADASAARAALIDRDTARLLAHRIRKHDDDVVRVETTLGDPEVVAALAAPVPDLSAAEALAQQSREAAREALRRHTEAHGAMLHGQRLLSELGAAVAEFEPAAQRQGVLAEVADTAAGNGANTRRMPLSSYVLAARLERVAELANERLSVMGEGRFELRHTDDRSGNAKSGLGLEVVDLWTGQCRPTSSLSGGESFMASLALALGLADAVREEAGGVDLQTLFVDEGFGTLDDESLEQVMAVLDTLRDRGRAVGVVSHVADLRTRIPRQVEVRKTPHGSSVLLLGVSGTDVA